MDWQDIVTEIQSWILLAIVGAVILGIWWWLVPSSRYQHLPMQRVRPISWVGIDVLLAFFLMEIIPGLVYVTLDRAGLYAWLYPGADEKEIRRLGGEFWASTLAPPIVVGLIVLGFQQLRGTRPVEMGLTRARAAVNVRLGLLVWLLLTPIVYALLYGTAYLVVETGGVIEQHPVTIAAQQSLAPLEWALMALSSLATIPVVEELIFRGVLLPWQFRGGWQAQFTVAFCAVFIAALLGYREDSYNGSNLLFVAAVLPFVFAFPYFRGHRAVPEIAPAHDADDPALVHHGFLLNLLGSIGTARAQPVLAIATNGLLFAAMHGLVWPQPVPLFALGIGLAWLRYRTSSLIAPIAVHALFNAVAMLTIVLKNILVGFGQ